MINNTEELFKTDTYRIEFKKCIFPMIIIPVIIGYGLHALDVPYSNINAVIIPFFIVVLIFLSITNTQIQFIDEEKKIILTKSNKTKVVIKYNEILGIKIVIPEEKIYSKKAYIITENKNYYISSYFKNYKELFTRLEIIKNNNKTVDQKKKKQNEYYKDLLK